MKTLSKKAVNKHLIDFTVNFGEISNKKLFYNIFQTIPSEFSIRQIKSEEFINDLLKKHKEKIIHCFTDNDFYTRENKNSFASITLVFNTGEILYANSNQLNYLYIKEELFSEAYFKEESAKYLDKAKEPTLRLFVNGHRGFEAEPFKIDKVDIDIDYHYNDDIKPFNENLFTFLNNKTSKGLHLLYGIPGTGKTNFLRHIIAQVKREVLFIPSGMTEILAEPSFFKILTEYTGSILIIEDAEKAITARETSDNNSVSTLLNISDGLLSDVLKMQIICTFNTDISKLDKALLRPGRLLTKYEFKELELNKAKSLAKKLGLKKIISKPATLAELYNDSETESIS